MTSNNTPILSARGLSYVYGRNTPLETAAIEDINIDIFSGELLGIIGHTGSGKSTFIQQLNGLLSPSAGQVLLNGEDINASKENGRNARFRVGLVFQYPEYQLFEETVYRDIAFGPANMGLSEDEVDARVRSAAGFVGVGEELFELSPLELSGGQKRRVAIAGVIAMKPEVLILDEPTAGLDPAGRESILQNIISYKEASGAAIVLVSHSMDDIARVADRLVVFSEGRVWAQGTAETVFERAQELVDIGLSVPAAAKLAIALKARGIALPNGIFSIERLRDALLALKGGSPC